MLKELLDGLMENRKPEFKTILNNKDVVDFIIVPEGMEVQSLKSIKDAHKSKPDRRKGQIGAKDLQSFSALSNRFKNANSALFQSASATETSFSASLKAVLNYSPAGDDNAAADNADHTVVYNFPLSEELKTWLAKNKVGFSPKEFAEFLEDNSADLVIPKAESFVTKFGDNGVPSFATPSDIVKLSRGIEIRSDEKVTQAFRVQDGSFNLQYTVDHKDAAGNALKLPEWFCLGIPVFENGGFYQIPVKLRFRVKEGVVTWFFDLYRKNDVFTTAFNKDCDQAKTETALPLYNGSPE